MASGGAEGDDGGTSLDIDNIHMLLQGQSISVLLLEMLWHVMDEGDTPNCALCRGDTVPLLHHRDAAYIYHRNVITVVPVLMLREGRGGCSFPDGLQTDPLQFVCNVCLWRIKLLMCLLQLFLIKTIVLIHYIRPYFYIYLSHSIFNFLLFFISSVLCILHPLYLCVASRKRE